MGKTALIVGASGLIGRELLKFLLDGHEYDRVIAIVRTSLNITNPKLDERIVHFEALDQQTGLFKVDDVFCCLGTTIKKAKSKEVMKRIDVDYPVLIANLAKQKGAKQYLVVSSLGANPHSSVWYSKMKGQLEEELTKLGFSTLHIFRPSLLLGNRKEFRLGEKIAAVLSPVVSVLLIGRLEKYRAIPAKTVALGMYKAAQMNNHGEIIYLSEEIKRSSESKKG